MDHDIDHFSKKSPSSANSGYRKPPVQFSGTIGPRIKDVSQKILDGSSPHQRPRGNRSFWFVLSRVWSEEVGGLGAEKRWLI